MFRFFLSIVFVFSSFFVFSAQAPQKRKIAENGVISERKRTRSFSQYKKTLKGLRKYISTKNLDRLSQEALEYFREPLQTQALNPNNFFLDSISGVFLLDLGVTPRRGQERKGLHMQKRSLHALTEDIQRNYAPAHIWEALIKCKEKRLFQKRKSYSYTDEDRNNMKISSVAMEAKYYDGSVNQFDLPGVVMGEGTKYLLDHGVERSVPGYKSSTEHVFKPYYSQQGLSGGVLVHRKYLQSFVKIGETRKYYLYSKWKNTLEPVAYFDTYEVNLIFKKDSPSELKITYKEQDGAEKTDVYHLAIRQMNGQDQFYFELPVPD